MDQVIRNKLRNVVTQCRKLLEDAVAQVLQGQFGIYPTGKKDEVHVEDESRMTNLVAEEDRACRRDLLDHFEHIQALGYKPKDALGQLVREVAFTHLNRLCAYKMMEARGVVVDGRPFREAVSRGLKSQGFLFYLANHSEDEKLYNSGHQDVAYRHFLDWLGGTLSEEIGVLFSPNDPANRLYPPQRVLDDVLDLINTGDIKPDEKELQEAWPTIWSEDETIGWVYQYFTPKELRDQARKESAAPRNSYELAFRNQFFTPRYVVEFLTDNTLGRIWYEMRMGQTRLKDQCRYMVRRPNEVFLAEGQEPPEKAQQGTDDLPQEELLKLPTLVAHRPKKDPRELRILDPACGSGHFLLYCFDLLETVYEEAYDDPDLGPALKSDYPTRGDLRRAVPGLILARNLHGIDIDRRATQIAALALWLRCHRAYQEQEIKKERPRVTKSNIVCAEPMPGEKEMLKEFVADVQPQVLGHLVEVVFDKMKLAGEAGSLLKIEEELRDAIAAAKRQWVSEHERAVDRKGRTLLFSRAEMERVKNKSPQPQLFDLSEITEGQFWNEAEWRVVEALRDYSSHTANGGKLRRQLFAEDAGRGFAFIDVCQKRFDVILMNPPFGDCSSTAKTFCDGTYPTTKADIGFSFVERGLAMLCSGGRLGAITSRVFLANDSLESWRCSRLLSGSSLQALADLGYGVLDEALVECAMYVVQPQTAASGISFFLRVLDERDKYNSVKLFFTKNTLTSRTFCVWKNLTIFHKIPGKILCYWLPNGLLDAIASARNLRTEGGNARHGLQTTDDFQFLRLAWEVSPSALGKGKKWVFFAKGGEYQPHWDDIHLVLNWENDGAELKAFVSRKSEKTLGVGGWSRWINAWDDYFKPGLTFPERTTSDFSPRVFPEGCIFSATGEAIIFPDSVQGLSYLAGAYTRHFKLVVDAFVGSGDSSVSGSAANHYRSGLVNAMPPPCRVLKTVCSEEILRAVTLVRSTFAFDETTRYFVCPPVRVGQCADLRTAAAKWSRAGLECAIYLNELSRRCETEVAEYLQFGEVDSQIVNQVVGPHPQSYVDGDNKSDDDELARLWVKTEPEIVAVAVERLGARRQITKKSYFGDRRLELLCHIAGRPPKKVVEALETKKVLGCEVYAGLAAALVSYAVGCAYGRWDIRFATGMRQEPDLPDPFAPLPSCPPGMLQGPDELPSKKVLEDYPLRVGLDGILPDDPEHPEDVVRRVREVLEHTWKERAEAVEKEVCEVFGVKTLRDYFRKPGKGGFWDDHLTRYSKSRRKAPIYWLLQSSKKNYALWLYYHRLDKDILFKALVNYVEPKIRLEENRLESLRGQKGSGGKAVKKLDKDIEKQENLLSELRDFEDKLRRAANLHLEPDLNDGVVLDIAPLWELVPWREAKGYWEELLEGEYEWSSIGKQLREKGLVK